jgi:hypothetical protein
VTGSMGRFSIYDFQFSIVFLPLYYPDMWMVTVLLFSKYLTKCGGVTEDQIGTLAVVRYWEIKSYERFSMGESFHFP